MSFDRTIIIDSQAKADALARVVATNWTQMHVDGHTLAARLYEYRDDATREQRALMWIRIGEIAVQAWVGGRQYTAETWHIQFKREFLPEEDGPSKRCRKNYRKWDFTPDGERILAGSTEGLTMFGKAEYLTQVMAYGASELGVHFAPTPREMAL